MVNITYSIINLFTGLTGMAGLILSFAGVTFQQFVPWIKFKNDRFLLPRFVEGQKYWEWVYYQISPFIVQISSETGESVTTWFYSVYMTITGVICLIGIVTGCIGIVFNKRKTTLTGGLVIIFSMITFATGLPGVYPNFSWGLGAKFTFYGSILTILSAATGKVIDINEKNKEYISLLKIWKEE